MTVFLKHMGILHRSCLLQTLVILPNQSNWSCVYFSLQFFFSSFFVALYHPSMGEIVQSDAKFSTFQFYRTWIYPNQDLIFYGPKVLFSRLAPFLELALKNKRLMQTVALTFRCIIITPSQPFLILLSFTMTLDGTSQSPKVLRQWCVSDAAR